VRSGNEKSPLWAREQVFRQILGFSWVYVFYLGELDLFARRSCHEARKRSDSVFDSNVDLSHPHFCLALRWRLSDSRPPLWPPENLQSAKPKHDIELGETTHALIALSMSDGARLACTGTRRTCGAKLERVWRDFEPSFNSPRRTPAKPARLLAKRRPAIAAKTGLSWRRRPWCGGRGALRWGKCMPDSCVYLSTEMQLTGWATSNGQLNTRSAILHLSPPSSKPNIVALGP
jgi:hypothetical protein